MDSDVYTDQGSFPIHGIRDVRSTVDRKQHDWSELAEAPEINTLLADLLKSYTCYGYVCFSWSMQFTFCIFDWWTLVCVTCQVHFLGQLSNDFLWSHLLYHRIYLRTFRLSWWRTGHRQLKHLSFVGGLLSIMPSSFFMRADLQVCLVGWSIITSKCHWYWC